ncbi:FliH/SctL family protein [Cohnella caldifontis]|uniref:FliH/SctL family protein n=1 Tax=Cohnella caldifontis TaxID=3027471 RepID=UPI0023EA7ABB|nr:FliH/SctL family protein [Cohnella sp. YIM B05605]
MSNLIKSGRVVSLDDLKQLELIRRFAPAPQKSSPLDGDFEGNDGADVETQSWKERILQDAEHTAQNILKQAQEEAAAARATAEEEAEAWWASRRAEDERAAEEARQAGFEQGYQEGAALAEAEIRQQWEDRLRQAEALIRQAYAAKERIIAEAESFVVDLSCAIASKLVSAQFEQAPQLAIRSFEQALSRRKEQGIITLCVAPDQFEFVQAAKDELILALDSQAELQIVPDASVEAGGCIVRSAFGSIDARIDTQLSVIRAELLRAAALAAEERTSHEAP